MAKKKTKLSLAALILTAVSLVGAVLAITGVFVDWLKYSYTVLGKTSDISYKLADFDNGEMLGAMKAFAYITLALAALSFLAAALCKILNMKGIQPLAALLGLLTIVSTILLIVFVCVFCSKNASLNVDIPGIGKLGEGKFVWAIGPILAVIGGFLSGLSALACYKK